jgi:hypothetical protein
MVAVVRALRILRVTFNVALLLGADLLGMRFAPRALVFVPPATSLVVRLVRCAGSRADFTSVEVDVPGNGGEARLVSVLRATRRLPDLAIDGRWAIATDAALPPLAPLAVDNRRAVPVRARAN